MIPFKYVKGLGAVAILATLYVMGVKLEAAEKAAAVKDFGLNTAQVAVLDQCMSALSGKKLRSGDTKANFCGCFVKTAHEDLQPEAYQRSVADLGSILSRQRTSETKLAEMLPLIGAANVVAKCANISKRNAIQFAGANDDKRSTWSSRAELDQWCRAKAERRSMAMCNINR